MFDATLPSKTPARVTVEGIAQLSWKTDASVTRLDHLHNTDPLRFLIPRRESGQPETAVLVTTSGGLVGGDRLAIEISARADAEGLAMTQAAEKIYGSAGPTTEITAEFNADMGAWLEWLPHETILFDGANLRRRTRLNLTGDAQAIAGEILVFGRVASGETLTSGSARECWEVRRDNRLVWADIFDVADVWPRVQDAPAGLAGARAMATIVAAGGRPEAVRDAARAALAGHETPEFRASATMIGELTIVRLLAIHPGHMRTALADTWGALRVSMSNFSRTLPRLWHM